MTDIRETVARALWQDESLRATGKPRRAQWEDWSEESRETWLRHADAALAACGYQEMKEAVGFAVDWASGLPPLTSDPKYARRVSSDDLEAFLNVMRAALAKSGASHD